MHLSYVTLAILLSAVLVASQAPTIPNIPDDYTATMEINRPDCTHTGCPGSETFHELRDYTFNRLKIVHSMFDEIIYDFNRYTRYHRDGFNCTTVNVTTLVINHHSWLNHDYDPATNHLVHSNDQYYITTGNFQYVGQSTARGIFTNMFNGSVTRTINTTASVVLNMIWHFSAANWTFDSLHHTDQNVPVRLDIHAQLTNNGNVENFHEIHDFIEFFPGVPMMEMFLPHDAFCAELVQIPIPPLPQRFSHTIERNDLRRNETRTGRFFFDYEHNAARIEHWEWDADVVDLLLVNNLQSYSYSWHRECHVSQITEDSHHDWADRLVNFQVSPPHLYPLTETVGLAPNIQYTWLFGGERLVRDIKTVMWFVQVNTTFPTPYHGLLEVSETVAWYFSARGWHVHGLPEDHSIPVRSLHFGAFRNASGSGQWEFFSLQQDFSDVKIGLEPQVFEIPPFCPGGVGEHSSSGLSNGGAAGLAIGMLILGGLLGAAILYFFTRRKTYRATSVHDPADENVSLRGQTYGSAL